MTDHAGSATDDIDEALYGLEVLQRGYGVHPRLGKQPKRVDSRTLQLERYVDRAVALDADRVKVNQPSVPPLNLSSVVHHWPMYLNNAVGDCGPAGGAHGVIGFRAAVAAREGKPPPPVPSNRAVLDFYSKLSGYDPRTGTNDNGVVLLDELNLWRKVGLGGHKIIAFAEVRLGDWALYDWAAGVFGGVLNGYQLPLAVQMKGGSLPKWTFTPDLSDPTQRPGSWGGHATWECDNDGQGNMRDVTWGQEMAVGRPFSERYRDEAYVVLSPEWITLGGQSVSGFAVNDLLADLKKVTV